MPVYDYLNEESGKVISVLVRLDEPDHLRHTQVQDGVTYKRIYAKPNAAVNVAHKDGTRDDFHRLTTDKKGLTVGQMQDLAKEMSAERESRQGKDPEKERYYAEYEKKMGDKHAHVKQREARARLAKRGIHLK